MAGRGVSRRTVLTAGAGAAAAFALPQDSASAKTASVQVAAAGARPNVLWLVSEDNNPFVGAYGDPLARTPTIDQLAADGVRYDNAFSNAPVCAPSRFAIITGMYPQSCGPAEHMRADGKIPAFLRGFPEYLRSAGYYCTNNGKTDYNAPISVARTWNASGASAHWRHRPAGAPFFAVFNFTTTHESNLFTSGPGQTRPQDVTVPGYLPDTAAIRADRAHSYNLMATMDTQVAARLAELAADGLAEDTVVFYYGDNGGALPRSKRYCFDDGLRVPLIARFPARWAHLAPAPPGSVATEPVSLVDLAPTVLALAGVPAPTHLQGAALAGPQPAPPAQYAFGMRNRMDERYDMVRTVRDTRYRYVRNYSPHRPYGQYQAYAWQQKGYQSWEQAHLDGVLNPAQDRFWGTKPAEELYDLQADPDELQNRVTEPALAGRLGQLRQALDAHLLAVNDNGFIPERSPLEGYDASRVPGAYPLALVMAVAGVAIARSPANLAYLKSNLAHANEVVRYWAAAGCLMLGAQAATAKSALTTRMNTDVSTQVRVVAAEAVALLGAPAKAVAFLAKTLDKHADPIIRLQALNALTFLGETARPVLWAVKRAANSNDTYLRSGGRYLEAVLEGTYTPSMQIY